MSTSPETPLVVHDLCKTFATWGLVRVKKSEILKRISFQVDRGSTFGFLGPNGAGKTTTIKSIVGLIWPTSGTIEILGQPASNAASRKRLGYLPENPSFHDHLTGREVLKFSAELLSMTYAQQSRRVGEVLSLVGIAHAADLQVRKYSKGMQQRLGIAQAILHEPDLVILDEPMSGLDPLGRREMKDLIRSLGAAGKTVFFSTHIIADVEEVCRDVAIIMGGVLVRSGKVSSLLAGEVREMEIVAAGVTSSIEGAQRLEGSELTTIRVTGDEKVRAVTEALWAEGARILSITPRRYGLEGVFMEEIAKQPAKQRMEG